MNTPVPTLIRGTLYPSMTAAARALNVKVATIFQAAERGTLDRVGLVQPGGPRKPCYINGQVWPSRTAAAKAIGVRRASISKALATGRTKVRQNGQGVRL